jgi:hypothetical protein
MGAKSSLSARPQRAQSAVEAEPAKLPPGPTSAGVALDFSGIPSFSSGTRREQRAEAAALPASLRNRIETRIGAAVGDVRLHRGPLAERAAAELGARAFTFGRNIVLGAGVDPAAPQAFPLLAHEAAHAAQQGGARAGDAPPRTRPDDAAEREADAAALGRIRPTRRHVALAAAPATFGSPTFKDLWPAFEAAQARFDTVKALDVARQLATSPSLDADDFVQHGIPLAQFLQEHGEHALAAKVLDEVRNANMLTFVGTGHKLPAFGFAAAGNDPETLIRLGEAAARAGRDDEAQLDLGTAHEILSYYALELTGKRAAALQSDSAADDAIAKSDGSEKKRLQALHGASELGRTLARLGQYSDLASIYDAMRRIYGVYSAIEREAQVAGNAAQAAVARTKSDNLHRVLREKFSWGDPQLPGPIGQDITEPAEVAEVSYVDTQRGPGLQLHGANRAETELTQLPGLPSPKEVGNNVQVQNLGNLQQALAAQSDFQAELAREPAIRKAFGNTPIDLNDTAQRQKVWRVMYGAFASSGGNALGALMALIGRYQKAYTIHTVYNVRDWGTSYLDSTMPTDLAGRAEKDCGVYALTVAWDVFETAKHGTPKLDVNFELFSMLEHVALVITDNATNTFYMVNNDAVTGPHTGDKLAQVASAYQGVRGLAYTVGPTVPVALGTTNSTESAFHDAAWQRYKASADWGLAPPQIPADVDALRKTDPAAFKRRVRELRDARYTDFYATQEALDRGVRALDPQIDALGAFASDPARFAQALAPVVDAAAPLARQFIGLGPTQPISAGSAATQNLLPKTASYVFTLEPGHSVHPLARVGRAVLHLQALGTTPSQTATALIQFCDAIPQFHDALQAYRSAGAGGPF